jgi:hypothetical protein
VAAVRMLAWASGFVMAGFERASRSPARQTGDGRVAQTRS